MTSQDVCVFVRDRFKAGVTKISTIIEEVLRKITKRILSFLMDRENRSSCWVKKKKKTIWKYLIMFTYSWHNFLI